MCVCSYVRVYAPRYIHSYVCLRNWHTMPRREICMYFTQRGVHFPLQSRACSTSNFASNYRGILIPRSRLIHDHRHCRSPRKYSGTGLVRPRQPCSTLFRDVREAWCIVSCNTRDVSRRRLVVATIHTKRRTSLAPRKNAPSLKVRKTLRVPEPLPRGHGCQMTLSSTCNCENAPSCALTRVTPSRDRAACTRDKV